MLTKTDILKMMKDLALPKDHYWILAGSGLVMHDIRGRTRDIDIGCTTALFEALAKDRPWAVTVKAGQRSLTIDPYLEVFENWQVDEILEIEGLPVASLLSIRKHKVLLGRPKDHEDIQRIDQRLGDQVGSAPMDKGRPQ